MIGRAAAEVAAAMAFLTRIPGPRPIGGRCGAAAFGVVGAALGLLASVPLVVIGPRSPFVAAVLALVVLALSTGGLHLDGLADTADALAAADREAAERARKDPRVGAAGATALVLVLLLQTTVLAELIARTGPWAACGLLVLATTASRAMAPAGAVVARQRLAPGSGRWFGACVGRGAAAVALGTTLVVAGLIPAIVGPDRIMAGLLGGAAWAVVGSTWLIHARGSLDGDGFGALTETTFAAVLLGSLAAR